MVHRPVDENGDILPVPVSASLLRGVKAEAQLVRDRLDLLAGDWWENPSRGNEALEMLRGSRLSETDLQALASYLSSYIRETPGVVEVKDVTYSAQGRQVRYGCTVVTGSGYFNVDYAV